MQISHRSALVSLIAVLATYLVLSAPCLAESYSEEPIQPKPSTKAHPVPLQGASCGTIGPQPTDDISVVEAPDTSQVPPMLPGATNGTIGPPGLDATYVGDQPPHELPFVPVFLLIALSLSVAAWGCRLMLYKKKAPIWALGIVAGSIIMVAGLTWHLLLSMPAIPFMSPAVVTR